MSQSQPFEFRSPHGIRKIESQTRSWNGITVRDIVHYPDPGRAWHDISSHETTVAIVLGQVGGYCESRLNLNRPTPRSRFDVGHATFVPADMTVWAYTDGLRSVVVRHSESNRNFTCYSSPVIWAICARVLVIARATTGTALIALAMLS
jgi:hypothetical protein